MLKKFNNIDYGIAGSFGHSFVPMTLKEYDEKIVIFLVMK